MNTTLVMVDYGYNFTKVTWNETDDQVAGNDSTMINDENIFDRTEVRVTFLVLYSIVFCFCVLGNLLVILVVMLSRRLRSTEFFLGNLAIADFCVGIFCILQTISSYMTSTWIFGYFLCKMHYFIHSLSCTTSIFILVVISIERYFVIMHPIRSRQIMTSKRLKIAIIMIWIISMTYSAPRFIFAKVIRHTINDEVEMICIVSRAMYNSELFDIINFVLLYLIPLGIMTVLYGRVAVRLWNSTQSQPSFHKCCQKCEKIKRSYNSADESVIRIKYEKKTLSYRTSLKTSTSNCSCTRQKGSEWSVTNHISCKNVLQARRGIIKMLIMVVLTFAICNIPFHARKMWQYWSRSYDASSDFSSLFTPLTFLLTYCNSAINPILYAFLSKNFRKSMEELSLCTFQFKHSKKNLIVESM